MRIAPMLIPPRRVSEMVTYMKVGTCSLNRKTCPY